MSGFSEEVVYIYFPKSLANSTDDISLVNDELLVFDKDPILTNTIEKVPGVDWIDFIFFLDGEDEKAQPLSVYITQGVEVSLSEYSIVSYRTRCDEDIGEIELFSFDDVNGGKIYSDDTGEVKVCLSHNDESINFEKEAGVELFKIQNNLISNNGESVFLKTNKGFVDVVVQRDNPKENFYVCLGSYDDEGNFGSCDFYSQNRKNLKDRYF